MMTVRIYLHTLFHLWFTVMHGEKLVSYTVHLLALLYYAI